MDIALLNQRVTFQKGCVVFDKIGNRKNAWKDYYVCHATVSGSSGGGQGGTQADVAGQTVDNTDLSFSVRYCKKAADITVTGYRLLFAGDVYDIVSIDSMNYKKKMLKFKCHKARR